MRKVRADSRLCQRIYILVMFYEGRTRRQPFMSATIYILVMFYEDLSVLKGFW